MKNWIAVPLLFLFILGLQLLFFGDVLTNAGSFIFGSGEDSIKNYYTLAYYQAFDQGLWFTGMNYPYGEHVLFTDSQPLFAYLARLFPVLSQNPVAFLNYLMLLSMPAGGVLLFLIARKCLLPAWYSMLLAVLIVFLSPQLLRFDGHYALSYTWVVPLFWYLAIRLFEKPEKYYWPVLYAFFTLLSGFIHPYFLLFGVLFMLASILAVAFQDNAPLKKNRNRYIFLLVMVCLPVVIFNLWLKFTDPVTDRPSTPYGFVAYKASLNSIFFPVEAPLKDWWQQVFRTEEPVWEGIAYVGLIGLAAALFTVFRWLRLFIRKKRKKIYRPVLPLALRFGLWAGILTLLFAMAIPFRWNLEFLLELAPPLKQFRSTGRFAWIFYYIFSVYTGFLLYQFFRLIKLRKNKAFLFLPVLALGIWAAEAGWNTFTKAAKIKQNRIASQLLGRQFNYNKILKAQGLRASNFQAILPVPFFAVGSEKLDIISSGVTAAESMKLSYHTGLPLATAMLSRTSLTHTLNHIQLFSDPLIEKELLKDFPNQKPFLVIRIKSDTLRPAEARILKQARLFYENPRVALYELPLAAFAVAKEPETKKAEIITIESLTDPVVMFARYGFLYQGFQQSAVTPSLFEEGALYAKKSPLILLDTVLPGLSDSLEYEASAWFYVRTPYALPVLQVQELAENGRVISEKSAEASLSFDVYRDWVRTTVRFKVKDKKNRLRILAPRKKITADGFMLRPMHKDYYFYTGKNQRLLKNNFFIAH